METLPSGASVPRVSALVTLVPLYHTAHMSEPWALEGVSAFCSTSHLSSKLTEDGWVSDSKQPQAVAGHRACSLGEEHSGWALAHPPSGRTKKEGARA